jgi:hypothetical protein
MAVQIYQQRRDIIAGGSGYYLGPIGTGKTYALRNEVEHVLNNTDEIAFVISKNGEFDDLVEEYNGIIIDLSKVPLNPLYIQDADQIMKEDLGFLTNIKSGLVKLLVEKKIPKLNSLQKYLIEQVMSKLYKECDKPDWNQFVKAFNTMIETYKDNKIDSRLEEIKESLNNIASELKLSGLHTDSILLKDTFLAELKAVAEAVAELSCFTQGVEPVEIGEHRLVVYNVKDIPSSEVDLYHLFAIEEVWSRLHGVEPIKHARLCIDDADNLFKHYDKYMSMLYKVARNQGLVITSVIHDTENFLNKKPVFRNIASYFELFGQSKPLVSMMRPIFSLSDEEEEWITNAPIGQKLVLCAGHRFLTRAVK